MALTLTALQDACEWTVTSSDPAPVTGREFRGQRSPHAKDQSTVVECGPAPVFPTDGWRSRCPGGGGGGGGGGARGGGVGRAGVGGVRGPPRGKGGRGRGGAVPRGRGPPRPPVRKGPAGLHSAP